MPYPCFSLFRGLLYLLCALCPKGNILSLMYVTCYLKHASACGPCTHDPITNSHAKCEQISAMLTWTFFHMLDIIYHAVVSFFV